MENFIDDLYLSKSDGVLLNTPFLKKKFLLFYLSYIKNVRNEKIEEEYDSKILKVKKDKTKNRKKRNNGKVLCKKYA